MRFTVQLAPDEEPQKKKRRIVRIDKKEVYKDIDMYTHKTVDGSALQDPRMRNAISSDVTEGVDGSVIARYVEFRDAKLRARLQRHLATGVREDATDELSLDTTRYVYFFDMYEEFNDDLLRPLAEYIHRFLVFGALFDWYSQFGMAQANFYGSQLADVTDEMESLLAGPSIVKKPLQPFGPAEKIY